MKVVTRVASGCALLLVAVVVVALLGVGMARDAERSVATIVDERLQRLHGVDQLLVAMQQVDAARAQILEHRGVDAAAHDRALGALEQHLQRLMVCGHAREVAEALAACAAGLERYRRGFGEYMASFRRRGVHHDAGAEGALREAAHRVEQQVRELAREDLLAQYLMIRRHEKDYLLRGDPRYVEQLRAAVAAFLSYVDDTAAAAEFLRERWREYADAFDALILARGQMGEASVVMSSAFDAMTASIDRSASLLRAAVAADAAGVRSLLARRSRWMLTFGVVGCLVALLVGIWLVGGVRQPMRRITAALGGAVVDGRYRLGVLFGRRGRDEFGRLADMLESLFGGVADVVERLRGTSRELERGASGIRRSSSQLSTTASRQAASVQEIAAAVTELSSIMRDNDSNVQSAHRMARDAAAAAARGNEATVQLAEAMTRMRGSSQEIARVIEVIEELAFQTNLLALNAAVEAARAGDAGRGFAVVAEEVGNLAKRSRAAAVSSKQLIEQSLTDVGHTVQKSGEVTAVFGAIDGDVRQVRVLLEQVAALSQEKARGLDLIRAMAVQVDEASQATASQSEELAAASAASTDVAASLCAVVDRFET